MTTKYEIVGTNGKCSFGLHCFELGTIVTVAEDQTNWNGDKIEAEACVFVDDGGLDQGVLWTDVKEVGDDA